jgi:hypothetical protein
MIDDTKFLCLMAGGIVAFFGVVVAGAMYLDSLSCHAKFEGSGLKSDWGIISGCRVNTPDQGWIPSENYRVL